MLDGLDEFCTTALAEHGCASVSLAVAEDDGTVHTRAYGLADTAARQSAVPATVYGLASITKAFTATAVCLAADEGLLDLDAPIPGDYPWTAPTPRHLLMHRGGFPAFYSFHYADDSETDTGADGPLPIDVDRYRALVREPGTAFEYSNLGYRELGRLLEAATGQDLGGYLRERIAEPLGLSSFGYGSAYPGPGPVAQRYTPDGRRYPVCRTDHDAAGAGWATAADVARFARTGSRLLKPGTVAAMHDAPPVNDRVGYGLGRIVSHGPGPVTRSHGGGMGGVAAMMVDLPESQLSVAVLANSTNKAARDAVVEHLVGALAPGFRNEQVNPITERTGPMALPPGDWSGRIDTAEGGVPLRVGVLPDGRVEIRLADGVPVAVPAVGSDRWDLRASAPMQLPTADARLNGPTLGLELRAEADRLVGRAVAYKDGDRAGLLSGYLVHPCELRAC